MSLSYDAMVEALVRDYAFSRQKAEAVARTQLGIPTPDPDAGRDARILEKTEQHEITKLFRSFGFRVYSLSQPRATKQTPGVPDLWCMHDVRAIAFYWETKRQVGGKRSPAQIDFADSCHRCNVGYGTGDRYAAQQHLIALGLAEQISGVLEPTSNSSRSIVA